MFDPDISILCPVAPVLIVPPFITISDPSYVKYLLALSPIENLYAPDEYPRKNHVPVLNAVCPHFIIPFVASVRDPAYTRAAASLFDVIEFATI